MLVAESATLIRCFALVMLLSPGRNSETPVRSLRRPSSPRIPPFREHHSFLLAGKKPQHQLPGGLPARPPACPTVGKSASPHLQIGTSQIQTSWNDAALISSEIVGNFRKNSQINGETERWAKFSGAALQRKHQTPDRKQRDWRLLALGIPSQ